MIEIRSARRAIVHSFYQEYQKTLRPSQWKYLPRTLDICAMDPFSAVMNAEADVVVTAADFEDAFRQLPELIAANFEARKLHARSLLKVPTSANQPTCSAPEQGEIVVGEASSSSTSLLPDVLNLATAVFRCHEASCKLNPRVPYLFGWDDIAQHNCKSDLGSYASDYHLMDEPGPSKIEFSAAGSEIAAAVVRVAGLDDKVATVSDMDAKTKDIRFGCPLCPPATNNGSCWTMPGFKWHELVCPCL